MPKISQHLGFTFKRGETFVKVDVQVDDIDTELPFKEQIDGVNDYLDDLFKAVRDKIDRQIESIIEELDEA